MFIAIPKDKKQIGWCFAVVAKSKGQTKRFLLQDDEDPKDFDILEVKDIQ